jgi:hypothetical protein
VGTRAPGAGNTAESPFYDLQQNPVNDLQGFHRKPSRMALRWPDPRCRKAIRC